MKKYRSLISIFVILVFILSTVPVQGITVVPPPNPLPKELNDYYWDLREENNSWISSVYCGCPPIDNLGYVIKNFAIFSPYKEFEWLKFAIYHDSGSYNTETSKMAQQYLMHNVIDPILKYKALKLEDGSILTYEDIIDKHKDKNLDKESLDRLVTAEMLYYYCRDYIYFPNPGENPEDQMAAMALPHVLASPCETISMQKGICWNQGIALATLYKMMGYDVALYLMPASPLPPYPIGGYHAVVLLKDEGWGIGTMQLEEDYLGNDISGTYIQLDPMYDLSYIMNGSPEVIESRKETIGELGLEFGDPSPYLEQPLLLFSQLFDYIPGIQTMFIGGL
ncbi:MAG: hypothetical protein EF806_02045 [Candidatus Methanoliparum thermophilum]|uniref:Transglutaminase-like domain-containing protein n=1 Tax=Methanoliparum thermophilum TaxID=2491083 RepID=A0A520KSG8_METT2|nr:hypothetical protein [Candidatus Methanoliparum sp. LAM-1]RZN64852.1 MAG: hypothetical protein EF806_02045 [Candidatus Methanoliparum thermophilum]BDC36275.1 hypothetical protein MTLP_09570 [Candidatus Methanoliparum sp. LAM-1]